MNSELTTFYAMVEDLDTAMMVTRRRDGHLRSRAMANQKPAAGADLWFVTAEGTDKLADLAHDPHVNLSYYRDANREWVSVSGMATVSRDRLKLRETLPAGLGHVVPQAGRPAARDRGRSADGPHRRAGARRRVPRDRQAPAGAPVQSS